MTANDRSFPYVMARMWHVEADIRDCAVIASVSGNDVYCSCFRIFTLSCCAWSVLVRWCPSPWVAVVTQLVTQPAFFSGILPGGLSLSAQPLSVGGWPVLRDLLQSVSNLFLGGRHGAGQPGRLASQPRRLLLGALRVFPCIRTGYDIC